MKTPPRIFHRLLQWFCRPELLEEIEGDLLENFASDTISIGEKAARSKFRREVLTLLRPSVIRGVGLSLPDYLTPAMVQSYMKVATRNIWRDRTNSLISITGLTLGLAIAFFILVNVRDEMRVDHDFTNAHRVYRVTNDERPYRDGGRYLATVGPPFAAHIEQDYAEVESAVRLRYPHDLIISNGVDQYYEANGFYADKDFFKIFDFPFAAGDPLTALSQPNSIVISDPMARKYFGNRAAIGSTLTMNGETELQVTGVLAPDQPQSHIHFDYLISFETFQVPFGYPVTLETWGWISFPTYLLLREGVSAQSFETKLDEFARNKVFGDRSVSATYRLQALNDIYFHSGDLMNSEDFKRGNLGYTRGMMIIALIILVIAGFNFMNLSTAQSLRRSREVGIRKVFGARKPHISIQFIGESLVISFLSLALAMLMFQLGGQRLANFVHWEMHVTPADYLLVLPMLLGLTWVVGIGSAIYPSTILSSFMPVKVLTGHGKLPRSQGAVQRGLVVLQFAVTVALIVSSIVVTNQIRYVQGKNLGFDQEQLVSLDLFSNQFLDYYAIAQNVLAQNGHVTAITAGDVFDGDYGSVPVQLVGSDQRSAMNLMGGYFDYLTTLGIKLTAGRDFSKQFPIDTATGVILNEAAVKQLGLVQPLGRPIHVNDGNVVGRVIGVAEDFHFRSLHERIEPLAIIVPRTHISKIILRVRPTNDVHALVASLRDDWQQIAPELPFQFSFFDEMIQANYEADKRFAHLVQFFGIIAIIIAGLGMYGLMAIIVTYRVKEIGIRKVLGASLADISVNLSRNFVFLVIIANLLAIPTSWYLMSKWLQNFVFSVDIDLPIFLLASGTSLIVVFGALGYQVIRSGMRSPVKALRGD